jgi:hypothetical protein
MKKVLVLEDNLVELDAVSDELSCADYRVLKASSTAKADDLLKREKLIDCLVIDQNISNQYLSSDLRILTHGGSLTGWVWLYYVAKPILTNKPKIIIYSEFINELELEIETAKETLKNVGEEESKSITEKLEYYYSVIRISKTETVNGTKNILEEVNRLFNKGRLR